MKKRATTFYEPGKMAWPFIAGFLFVAVCCSSCGSNKKDKPGAGDELVQQEGTVVTSITISPDVPFDINDPADLAEAANFAWNEFIALTWPAKAQGPVDFPRGQPDENGTYGEKGSTGQVVWETYRHRVEAFPGMGYPNGYDSTKADYGFSSKPVYIYENGTIPPINKNSDTTKHAPYANLDEVTQISLNSMFAGASGSHTGGPSGNTVTAQKILFEAKVNEAYYKYVAGNKYFQSDSSRVQNIKFNSGMYAISGDSSSYKPPYTNLPSSNKTTGSQGAIEIKAAWRRLNPQTEDITTFYTNRVRIYSGDASSGQVNGYIDSDDPGVNEVWGLVALHIIHKTPNAPSFVYATFSHFNNILDSAGNSVEDADGTTLPQYLSQEPFSPAITIIPSSPPKNIQKVFTTGGRANTNSPQLYFQNVAGKEAINVGSPGGPLYSGPVVVNRRIFPIPPVIVNANKTAHDLIRKTNSKAIWLNYKLVNVQARPLDYNADSLTIKNGLEATYFLANEVVETNPSLQHFSGGLNVFNGTIFNYDFKGNYDYNVFNRTITPGKQYLMGGCMGCHGSQGQKAGGDFSVLLANGRILSPDVIEANTQDKKAVFSISEKYRAAARMQNLKK